MATTSKATWIWYPGDYEIWLGNKMNNRRTDRGAYFPPFWKQDSHYVTVEFSKAVSLDEDETLTMATEGDYNVKIDGKMLFGMPKQFVLPAGSHNINIKVHNQATPPTLYVSGKTVKTDETWNVTFEDKEWIDESGNVSYTVLRPDGKVENMTYGDVLESARIPYDTFDAYMRNPNEMNLDKANEEAVMIEEEERENNRRIKVNTGLGLPADADIRFRENGIPTNDIIGVNITDDNGDVSKGYLLGRTDGIDGSMAQASVMLPDGNVVPVNADRIIR